MISRSARASTSRACSSAQPRSPGTALMERLEFSVCRTLRQAEALCEQGNARMVTGSLGRKAMRVFRGTLSKLGALPGRSQHIGGVVPLGPWPGEHHETNDLAVASPATPRRLAGRLRAA
jgi:hypothetical protein